MNQFVVFTSMKLFQIPVFALFLTLVVSSCNEDCDDTYDPTPYDLNIPPGLPPMEQFIPADNPMTVEGVALGRKLFYEPMLSDDNSQSCSSCHVQENGFAELRQFSEGIDGSIGNRNAMPIINLGWNQFGFFWDGREETLESQALKPVTNPIEMNTTWPEVEAKLNAGEEYQTLFKEAFNVDYIDSLTVAKALAQFERTLISGNSRFDKWYNRQEIQLTEQETRGFVLYNGEEADCFHCHGLGGLITNNQYSNNGMDQVFLDEGRYLVTGLETDKGKFRVPTLRNIAVTAPYMHDGRFFTLEQVIEHYSEHVDGASPNLDPNMELVGNGGAQLTPAEKADLLAFLRTFTDEEFLTNPDFSNPNP